MSPRRFLRLPLLLLVVLLAAVGCGTEDADEAAGEATSESEPAAGGASQGGDARIIIDGRPFRFTPESCEVGEGDDPTITVTGSGESDGEPFQASVTRERKASGTVIESAKVDLTGDAPADRLAVFTNAYTDERGASAMRVDGASVLASIDFIAAGDAPTGAGLIRVTCG